MRYFFEFHIWTQDDEGDKDLQREFNMSTESIVFYFSSFFKHVQIPYFKDIRYYLTNKPDFVTNVEPPIKGIAPICVIYMHYDYINRYINQPEEIRIAEIKSLLQFATELACDKMNLDIEQFNEGFKQIEEQSLPYTFRLNKPKKSKNRKREAVITVEVSTKGRLYYLEVVDFENEKIFRIALLNILIGDISLPVWWHDLILKDGRWITNDEYQVYNSNKNSFINCDILSRTSILEMPSEELRYAHTDKDKKEMIQNHVQRIFNSIKNQSYE
ncbi:MAG: hypothetical protein JST82_07070 [Bacteroidetes bacterium]|nr:hypothetical protein [Bacteroidota bacterium]